jgi:hypothetical protein
MTYEQALEKIGLNPDIRLRQMFELGRLAAHIVQEPVAEVIAKTKLENSSTELTPRIIALTLDLSVGDKLYTTPPAQPAIDPTNRNKS